MSRSIMASLLAAILLSGVASAAAAAVLKQEPSEGTLRAGQAVLVDDGTCPPGEIKQVTGGANLSHGQYVAGKASRQTKCIKRK
jgi:hypothetical protein